MTARTMTMRGKALVWLLVGAGLLIIAAANAHLVYVAMRSQPDCVQHARAGDVAGGGRLSAAASACASP